MAARASQLRCFQLCAGCRAQGPLALAQWIAPRYKLSTFSSWAQESHAVALSSAYDPRRRKQLAETGGNRDPWRAATVEEEGARKEIRRKRQRIV